MREEDARDQFVYAELAKRLGSAEGPIEHVLDEVVTRMEEDAAALFPWLDLEEVPGFSRVEGGPLVVDLASTPVTVEGARAGDDGSISDGKGRDEGVFERVRSLASAMTAENYESALRHLAGFVGEKKSRTTWAAARARAVARLKELGVSRPDDVVKSFLGKEPPASAEEPDGATASTVPYDDVPPWPEPVNGADLLDDLARFMAGPVVLPEGGATAIALYVVMTHIVDMLVICPYLAFPSPTMRAGKTTVQDLIGYVARRSLPTANCTPAAIFRELQAHHPTLIIDEAETFLGDEELRGILNGGYNRDRPVLRAVPSPDGSFQTARFDAFGPKVFGLIGKLPPTLQDRSIVVPMQRKRPTDAVEPFRRRQRLERKQGGRELARKIVRWVEDNRQALNTAEPSLPEGLDDRASDNWEPLFIVADVAGGRWPERARRAAATLSATRDERREDDKILLLADIYRIFDENGGNPVTCEDLAFHLSVLEERPWGAYGRTGKRITSDRIGKFLGEFGVRSKPTRVPNFKVIKRVYRREFFLEAWERHGVPAKEDD